MTHAGDIAAHLLLTYPTDEGYVIAFSRPQKTGDPGLDVLFVKQALKGITGGFLLEAKLWATYAEAAAVAASWSHTQPTTTRILKVRRQAPITILEDLPAHVLDALAEI